MKKTRWITETAVMLALLIALQWATKPLGQIVTGSCVNTVLAVSVLFTGMSSGITVALLSPIFAYLFGIAPQLVVVPAIMIGNAVFVFVLRMLYGKPKQPVWTRISAWITSALLKFMVLYTIVSDIICGLFAPTLLEAGLLKAPMLEALPTTFALPQLLTALIGGGLGLLLLPALRKALHREV